MDMTNDRRLWSRRSEVRARLQLAVGSHVIVGDVGADPKVATVLDVDEEGHIQPEALGSKVGLRLILALATLALTVSCGGASYGLPDRADDQVKATEAHLAQVVGAARGGADCDIRLLGESDGSSFVWAECFGPVGGISAPMRVDGDDVRLPGDGNRYADDVRRLFPADVAAAILTDQERLKP